MKPGYTIREIRASEIPLLEKFLYEAIYVPDGVAPPPKTITAAPELQVYLAQFGEQKDDKGLVAEAHGNVVGAVWARIMKDYGHLEDETPSLAISVLKEYRGLGIGTSLLSSMLSLLKENRTRRVSLAVQKENFAVRMYRAAGFKVVRETDEEFLMVNELHSFPNVPFDKSR